MEREEKIPNWKARVGLHVNTIPIIVFLIGSIKHFRLCVRVMFARRAAN